MQTHGAPNTMHGKKSHAKFIKLLIVDLNVFCVVFVCVARSCVPHIYSSLCAFMCLYVLLLCVYVLDMCTLVKTLECLGFGESVIYIYICTGCI